MTTKTSARVADKKRRTVYPPSSGGFGMSPGALLSVALEEDEEVVWHWTHQDGRSIVTGYTIVPRSLQSLLDRLPQ